MNATKRLLAWLVPFAFVVGALALAYHVEAVRSAHAEGYLNAVGWFGIAEDARRIGCLPVAYDSATVAEWRTRPDDDCRRVASTIFADKVLPAAFVEACEAAQAFADDHERRGQYAFASGARLTMHNFMGCP